MRASIEKTIAENGLAVDSDSHEDLQTVMGDMTEHVRSENITGSFRRIFWDQQLTAMKKKDPR